MSRVLVVDDEPDLRFMMRLILEQAGYEVLEAGQGIAALRSIHEQRPDLVVTDIMMPLMAGDELIKQLRADPATATIPILVVSGNSEQGGGADRALEKPFNAEDLVRVANELLSRAAVG